MRGDDEPDFHKKYMPGWCFANRAFSVYIRQNHYAIYDIFVKYSHLRIQNDRLNTDCFFFRLVCYDGGKQRQAPAQRERRVQSAPGWLEIMDRCVQRGAHGKETGGRQ